MKKITLLMTLMVMAILSFGQTNSEEIDLVQAAFGMEKKVVVANFVQLNEFQEAPFWLLYEQYEVARKENGKKRIQLLEQYAAQYNTMTDEQAEEWMKEVIKLSAATEKLIVTYYKKIKKDTSPIVATQFYQIENYILTAIRMEILEAVPFLGE